jgi:hypothetical protein
MDSMNVEKADERRVWTIWALGAERWTYIYTYLTYFNIYTYLILIYIYLFNL